MDMREEITKRIERKEEEIREYEMKIAEAKAYLQALTEMQKLIPKAPVTPTNPALALRAGTAMAKAREAILKAGKPLHISEILKALGRPVDRANRGSIAGSLSAYVRNGEIFTKIAPNTFGLVEMGTKGTFNAAMSLGETEAPELEDEPPASFGIDDESTNGKVVKDEDIPF
jgi:hypothetical protein